MTGEPGTRLNEHILEIRYKPNPKILDLRGTWAEAISQHMGLSQWRIIENRIDIFDEGETLHVFVGFRNSGIIALDTPTQNFFSEKAGKLFTLLFRFEEFGDRLFVERIGVRSKFCSKFDGSFNELRDRYVERFLNLTTKGQEAIGNKVKLVDIGGPINFVDHLGNFNTNSGPMTDKQFPQFFKKNEGFPEVGLFFDIDYWKKPVREIPGKEIIALIKEFAKESWERHERVRNLIVGD